jgi:lipopolysaccharide export system permease protein
MFKHIDWLMIVGYFKSYAICLISLLTLYIVVDLFMHLDDFVSHNVHGLGQVVTRITVYYGYRVPQFFDRMTEAIVLLAGMFTVAMMQKNNEQLPLLSAGVSTHRIIAPVLFCACFMHVLTVLNQELIIPRIGDKLTLERSDPGGSKEVGVSGGYEPNQIHLTGERASRLTKTIRNFQCTIPENITGNLIHISAQEARYDAENSQWLLTGCYPRNLAPIPDILEIQDVSRYVLHVRVLDFEAMVRDPRWFNMASTWRLFEELQRPESTRLSSMAVQFHARLTRPLLGMVLVLMGLGIILRDQTRNVFISSGLCLGLCGLFFAALHASKMLGDRELFTPALAAWMPVLIFGPFSVVMFDAVHT